MRKIIVAVLVVALLLGLIGCGAHYEDHAIDAAKSYVSSQFFNDFGMAADELECEVIYSEKNGNGDPVHLIAVRCYWDGAPTAAYCVYTKLGTFRNATQVLPSGYDFGENMSDLKAMFGIVS